MTDAVAARDRAEQMSKELALNSHRMQVLLQLNQMREATLKETTDFALEEAVRLTQSTIGYLAFLNEDESVLTMHAWSKSAMAECAIIDKPIIYPVVTTGLWGEAVRQRRPVFTNDYAADNPLKKGYPQGHVAVKRHMNVPVFEGSRIVIVAGVGNKNEEYSENDAQQLTLLMEGMWRLIERKKVGEELRIASLYARNLIETSLDPLVTISADGKITDVNKTTEQVTGVSREKLIGSDFSDYFTEPEKAREGYKQVFTQGFVRDYPLTIRHSSGHTTDVLYNASVYKNEAGEVQGVFAAARDITERKQAEEETKKQLDELFRWHNATLGRESRILDLKREVNELLGKAGDPPRYPSAESQDKKEE
jgi:PAS domain S-box-containing protein